jgi:hypothetical protein
VLKRDNQNFYYFSTLARESRRAWVVGAPLKKFILNAYIFMHKGADFSAPPKQPLEEVLPPRLRRGNQLTQPDDEVEVITILIGAQVKILVTLAATLDFVQDFIPSHFHFDGDTAEPHVLVHQHFVSLFHLFLAPFSF